jgi:hypothetical protein
MLTKVASQTKCFSEKKYDQPLIVAAMRIADYARSCAFAPLYPVLVLHTAEREASRGAAEIDGEALLAWMEQLRAAAPALQMLFLDVSEEFARVHFEHSSAELSYHDLLWQDMLSDDAKWVRKQKPRRYEAEYRHMCRFMGTTVPRLAALSGFRYALHVDDDAALTCHPTSGDPFEAMAEGDHVYGLFEYGFEGVRWARGWRSFIEEVVYLNEYDVPNVHIWPNHTVLIGDRDPDGYKQTVERRPIS